MNKIKGSEWRKWDLHFHTPSSYDYADKSVTNSQIIEGLERNGISTVAITDHHIIDVERIIQLQKLGASRNITVLPGIEFLGDARGTDPIHFIGIFPQNSNIGFIWKQIESKTEIEKVEGEKRHVREIYCDLIDTAKLIKELGGIVSIHAGNKSNSIENITNSLPQAMAQKVEIAKFIDMFEIGRESDCAEYNKLVIPFLKKTIGRQIPLVICSDNHNINQYSIKQNLWIKADQTFEGLKQIIFEPEHRVKIQKEKPDFKEGKLVIDEVRFICSNNKFTKEPIYLNDNLNVIIGGKSSGKSIFLYNIAKTLLADKDFLRKENILEKYDFRANDTNFNFEIKTKGGFPQLMHRPDSENSIIPEIKYIPQNYLVKLAEPEENKTGNALNKIIRDLINEDRESQSVYDDFIVKVKGNDRLRESLIDGYFELIDHIAQMESQLKLKTNKEILKRSIESNSREVETLNKSRGMSTSQITEYNSLQSQLEGEKQTRNKATNDYRKIKDFNSDILSSLAALKDKKNLLSKNLENVQLKDFFDINYQAIDSALEAIEKFALNFETVKDQEGANKLKLEGPVFTLFKELQTVMRAIEKKLEPFLANEEIKKKIEVLVTSISTDKNSLQEIDQLSKEILDNRRALENKKNEIFELYKSNHSKYIKVIESLKVRTVDLERDGLKIEGIAAFNFPKFRKAVLGFSDGRTASYKTYKICNESKQSLSSYELVELIEELKSFFDSIENGKYILANKINKKTAMKIILEDYLFDYWQIEYKNDKLGKMSTGKASFVILMLIVGLSKSKAPILIDQPEDNLDNRSITSDLVEYLKNKKLERQIILVTHNANIVVNADAENVIIAHQKGQENSDSMSLYQFDYINGPLENSFPTIENEKDLLKSMGIREHIADIVEGGVAAFQKREEKYGFKSNV
jgi:hypothetical protein